MPGLCEDGVMVLDRVLDAETVAELRRESEPLLLGEDRARRPGVRRVFQRAPRIRELVEASPVRSLIETVGGGGRVVRTILFDKTPETNWSVPWHQDATIAVRTRIDVDGYGPWSVKDGGAHCRPPRDVLDSIVVIRMHLDDCGPENGPLRVIPRSHRWGILPAPELEIVVAQGPVLECCTPAGGAVVMRPHVLHASPKASSPTRRRVLHLECCPLELAGGLEWTESL